MKHVQQHRRQSRNHDNTFLWLSIYC